MVQALLGSLRSSGDPEIDKAVYDNTLKEKERGFSVGPFTQAQLSEKFGTLWVASRRFGVSQGFRSDGSRKIRSVDDLSEFGINSTISVDEKVDLGGVDRILATGKTLANSVDDHRHVKVPNGSGGYFEGELHSDWSLEDARSIQGRTVDLEAAYKNLVTRMSDAPFSIFGVFNPETNLPELWHSVALMFGASGAVYGFNRAAVALRRIMIVLFHLHASSFFDDYVQEDLSA